MADVVFILLAVGFFGLCVAYVRGVDRLVRTADETPDDDTPEAPDGPTGVGSRRAPGQTPVGTGETVEAGTVEAAEAVDESR